MIAAAAERLLPGLLAVLGLPFLLGAAAAPAQSGQVVFAFQDPAIIEASALVVQDGLVYTSNDSGDTGRVFAVDPATGDTVGVTHWSAHPTDVESLAPGPRVGGSSTVWVADIGDNDATRDDVQIARVPVGRGERTVRPTVYDLAYPDGAHNAETLVRDPGDGRLYIATKEVFGGTLYAVPRHLDAGGVNRLTPLGPVLPIATDGAFLPDGRHLVIRGYGSAEIYDWPSLDPLAGIGLPAEPQGEGIGVGPDGEILLDSEGLHSKVLRLVLPVDLQGLDGVGPQSTPPSDTAHPAPSGTPSGTPSGSPSVSPAPAAGAYASTTSADHTTYWAIGGAVALLGLGLLVAGARRRKA